jgi:hypothetical protein
MGEGAQLIPKIPRIPPLAPQLYRMATSWRQQLIDCREMVVALTRSLRFWIATTLKTMTGVFDSACLKRLFASYFLRQTTTPIYFSSLFMTTAAALKE